MKIIILAGGSGSRLWPLSRSKYPKQFLKLKGMENSIFQLTIMRSLKLADLEDIYIVTNQEYRFLISGQIEEMGYQAVDKNILLEPEAKNTLPAIMFGINEIQKKGEDIVAVFPSDHLFGSPEKFVDSIKNAKQLAQDYLVTFGVLPDLPETGYGYIKPGKPLGDGYLVEEFKEKPDILTAKEYVEAGYYWNCGIFLFHSSLMVEEVKKYSLDVYAAFQQPNISECFALTPNISIDYGIMERSNKVAVLPMDIKWNDLGSFLTFYDEYSSKQDENSNVYFNNEVIINANNNLIYSEGDKAIGIIGVDDLVIIDQKDALLICQKDETQKVKDVVEVLKKKKR